MVLLCLCVIVLVFGPVLFLRRAGASWSLFAAGIASWMLAFPSKIVLSILLGVLIGERFPPGVRATLEGLLSALIELAAAAYFLRGQRLALPEVLAFGAAFCACEVLVVLGLGWLQIAVVPVGAAATALFALERLLVLAGHIASRVLIHAGLSTRRNLPLAIALGLFTLLEGLRAYRFLVELDWSDPAVLARFAAFVAIVVLAEIGAARHFWRLGP